MIRSEIQKKTGLTRKAIEYYEKKKLITPKKYQNGYRDYSEKDLDVLMKISLYRKIGLSVDEIEQILECDKNIASVFRNKEFEIDFLEKRKDILKMVLSGESNKRIDEYISLIEKEETIYNKLERAFPGYFGQMMFSAYQPFLNEKIKEGGEAAYLEYIDYLDSLEEFSLTENEQEYVENLTSSFSIDTLEEINFNKIEAIENTKRWMSENREFIAEYNNFKNSLEYLKSPLKEIEDKFKKFMLENNYYDIAIPLIRKFSKSYDEYYIKLIEANKKYIEENNLE